MQTINSAESSSLFSPFDSGAKITQENASMTSWLVSIYSKSLNSDVIFSIDGRQLKAHRAILAAQSPVFEAMLLEKSFKEANVEVIELPGKNADSFEIFLKYFYAYPIELGQFRLETIIEVLHLANEYQVEKLAAGLDTALETVIGDETVFQIFDSCLLLNRESLLETCRQYIFTNVGRIIKNFSKIQSISKSGLIDLISDDLFNVSEIEILFAVENWHQKNPDENVKDVLKHVRFGFVSLDGIKIARVAPLCKFLSENNVDLEIIGDEAKCENSAPRVRCPEIVAENVATLRRGAEVVDLPPEYLPFFFESKKLTWIGYLSYNSPVIVKLPTVFRISSIAFDIYGNNNSGHNGNPCFYKIETSEDRRRWRALIDCRVNNCACYRHQLIMFRPRSFQYVKLTAFQVPGYADAGDYSIESFQCPADVSHEETTLYAQDCPTGKTLLYQRQNKETTIFD